MGYHARLGPSSAARWTTCTASPAAQDGMPNTSNEASQRGTACHLMLEELLLNPERDPQSYLGRTLVFWIHPESVSSGEDWSEDISENPDPCQEFIGHVEIDQELIDISVTAVNYVRERVRLTGAEMYVEQAVPIGQFTGEEGATGRTDVVLIYGKTVEVIDLKGGRGRVDAYDVLVPAQQDIITGAPVPEVVRANLQMACYALGTIETYSLLYDFDDVVMTIVQPAIKHVSTYWCMVSELREVEAFLKAKAEETRTNPQFVPSPDACHFCRASGNCAAQTQMVTDLALDGFDTPEPEVRQVNPDRIGQAYSLVPLVRDWVSAIETQMYDRLSAGERIVRDDGLAYKLVAGKKGARSWEDEDKAEAELKRMRLKADLMYKRKVISPTDAEKLATPPKVKKGADPLPPVLGPTQWSKLQAFITQSEGKPSIVLETDPRPAVATAMTGFDDVPAADNSDLF